MNTRLKMLTETVFFMGLAASVPAFADTGPVADSNAIVFSLQQGELVARSQLVHDAQGNISYSGLQDKLLLEGRLTFLQGLVRMDLSAGTGKNFALSYDRTGLGTGGFEPTFAVRNFSLTLKPNQDTELSVGSFAPSQGAGSENTFLDVDGYLTGYRVKAEIEGGELIVTVAHLGNLNRPSVFDRLGTLDNVNFAQLLFAKSITKAIKGSIELDKNQNDYFTREAVAIDVSQLFGWVQTLTVESLIPLSATDTQALAAGVTFSLAERITLTETVEHATLSSALPLGDHVFAGDSIRSVLKFGKIGTFPGGSINAFVDYVQSLNQFSHSRLELGIQAKIN